MSTHTRSRTRPPVTLARLLLAFALLVVLWPAAHPAAAAPGDLIQEFGATTGRVYATALVGDTLYVGGLFKEAIPYTGGFAALGAENAVPDIAFPSVKGNVNVIVSDGAGGWYLGGDLPNTAVAHIRADKTLDPAWNITVTEREGDGEPSEGHVNALAVIGTTVYVGGEFQEINGQQRINLAALDATTGALKTTRFDIDEGTRSFRGSVNVLAVSGNILYIGGDFLNPSRHLAALDTTTGELTPWNPDADSFVTTLAVNGTTVYVGGEYNSPVNGALNYLTAFDATTGARKPWNPSPIPAARALAVSGSTVYVGSAGVTALDATTGNTVWQTNTNGEVYTLAVNGGTVYAGGQFTNITGRTRNRLAAFNTTTGALTSWNPNANNGVSALALNGNTVSVGGSFNRVGKVSRNYLAAFNTTTGRLTSWNPSVNQPVETLSVRGSRLYIGGSFTSVGGKARNRLAALDLATGNVSSWNPNFDVTKVTGLAVSDTAVYATGYTDSGGGNATYKLKAFSPTTGATLSWNPNPNGYVRDLLMRGDRVYVSGTFTQVGGKQRKYLAALNATTGAAFTWNPNPNNFVTALAVSGSTVYIGGDFTTVGGKSRSRLAALSTSSGAATDWKPNVGGDRAVELLVRDNTVFAIGDYYSSGGPLANGAVAFDRTSGAALAWNPRFDNQMRALTASSSTIYIGGDFTRVNGGLQPYLSAFARPDVPTSTRTAPPEAAVGTDYAHTFGEGDADASAWRVTSGALPDGMTLHADGTLSGTPTTSGIATFTVADANHSDASETVTLTITTPTATPRVYLPLTVR